MMQQSNDPMVVAAKKELERMIDLVPQGMLLVDGEGIVLRTNIGMLRILGLPSFASVLKKSCVSLFPAATATMAELQSIFHAKTPSSADSWDLATDTQLPHRGLRSLTFTVIPAGRAPRWFMVIVKDVTEEKAAQKDSEKTRQLQTTETVVGGLAHAVNQPLTVIMSNAYLILQGLKTQSADTAQMAEMSGRIMDRVNYITELLNRAQSLKEFVVEPYDHSTNILDLKQSGR